MADGALLEWDLQVSSELVCLALRGEMDMSAPRAISGAADAVPHAAGHVVIDLTEVTFLDGAGLDVLMDLAAKLVQRGIQIEYGSRHRLVDRYLDLSKRELL